MNFRKILILIIFASVTGAVNHAYPIDTNYNVDIALSTNSVGFLSTLEVDYTAGEYQQIINISTNYSFAESSVSIEVMALNSNSFTILATCYEISNFTFPGLEITAINSTDTNEETNTFFTPAFTVEASVTNQVERLESIEEIYDIKDYSWIWITLGAMLGSGLLALLIIWLTKNVKQKIKENKIVIDPYAEALKELGEIKDSFTVTEENYKEYYALISEVTRRFIERVFKFNALEFSTSEINREIKKLDIKEDIQDVIKYILKFCDRVKYAKHKPNLNQISQILDDSFALVQSTQTEYDIQSEDVAEPPA